MYWYQFPKVDFEALLANGFDPDATDDDGYTALMGNLDDWRFDRLVDYGVDVNRPCVNEYGSVFFALNGCVPIPFDRLWENGASCPTSGNNYHDKTAECLKEKRRAILIGVLSIVGLPRGVALLVVRWCLKTQ